jgi:transcriptional regulator with GAF, ATPase, and Fis domain
LALQEREPNLKASFQILELDDPTDYGAIFEALSRAMEKIRATHSGWELFISITSGTPQMHATWLALVGSGRIEARVLNVRPARFVSLKSPLITEISPIPRMPALTERTYEIERAGGNGDSIMDLKAARSVGMVGDDLTFAQVVQRAATLAPTSLPVLIAGETGTGKELIARYVHQLSGRPKDIFVPLNCAAIPKELFESTLFGHKKGSFTGATEDRKGKFELANRGTLFLDELGEMPIEMQPKLLRVLQDGIVEPVGESRGRKVDVRVIAATNVNIEEAVVNGKFRSDLYYRLKVGVCRLPALRERRSDIHKLAFFVIERINASLRKSKRFTPAALEWLQSRTWKGNIRELENTIESAAVFSPADVIDVEHLKTAYGDIEDPAPATHLPEPHEGFALKDFLQDCRQELIARALKLADGNQTKAAALLGLTPQALSKEVRKP